MPLKICRFDGFVSFCIIVCVVMYFIVHAAFVHIKLMMMMMMNNQCTVTQSLSTVKIADVSRTHNSTPTQAAVTHITLTVQSKTVF